MSNNFELLSQLENAERVFPATSDAACRSSSDQNTPTSGKLPNRYSEALNLVQRVFLAKPEVAPQVVVFTSPQSGSGCSWVCARASEALAERFPGSVCAVDCNLRSPAMHRYFVLNNSRGLAQALVEKGADLRLRAGGSCPQHVRINYGRSEYPHNAIDL